MDIDKMVIVVVGDEELIQKGLKDLGWGKLKTIDPDKITVKKVDENANRSVETQTEVK